ncbi:hypothetical protein PFAG_05610 [Plasmodium falciparum Santa Lucia]|uniref:Uncharacterized protein n=7 Tax=Plasmodium falciparum TaxID=5833 RepID=A0A024VXF5_PLAFA|nr:hypothetical protein PFFVO_05141 [Plasmodium falciparum Vietnam Oak-Knoll (FVO)]ETW32895.1 hypothetical protein PFTANZ_06393 [Plasmodium falciparum Tanzania (2000708)]ETW39744.1 hypothetical protein PFNF135_05773 [Plasmodium falciparum NF135/5.C10]ETW46440.1 hypothetical protein PFMALIP_05346 [Plasmodium falciparum MaliPS096_E11]ETW58488.1 hypothetical protein PFMC_05588 [Plasmodium falciparum CAMP/Malaysia]EUR62364.1 hypothetical protein PFBG_05577 [Plasmodium falciparum 7G8]EUT79037.1 hy
MNKYKSLIRLIFIKEKTRNIQKATTLKYIKNIFLLIKSYSYKYLPLFCFIYTIKRKYNN